MGRLRSHPYPRRTLVCQAADPDSPVRGTSSRPKHQTTCPHKAPGFCGLPGGVDSPSSFKAYWYTIAKPRLEALYRACAACGPEVQLLILLDQFLCELKNIQIKGRHCGARHSKRCDILSGLENSQSFFLLFLKGRTLHLYMFAADAWGNHIDTDT
jgi:hypothetical protein